MTYKMTTGNLYIPEKDYTGTDHVETPSIFFDKFISDDWCDKLVAMNDRKLTSTGGTFGAVDNVRKSEIAWMREDEDRPLFDRVMDSALKSNWWGYDTYGFSDGAQYTIYDANKQDGPHYDWHKDTGPGYHHRKMSFVILLTDGFEGGELEVSHRDGNVLKNKGSAVLFPSINYHRVKPVTRGVRKSLVFWIAGPKLR
jgi:PKHD-type hydroxylase